MNKQIQDRLQRIVNKQFEQIIKLEDEIEKLKKKVKKDENVDQRTNA